MTWLVCVSLLIGIVVVVAAIVDANETSATVEEQQSCQAADLHGAAAGECLATQNTPVAAGREAREDDIGYAPSWDAAYAQRRRHEPQPCSLYFAPSTLPNAGWGLFTARPYKRLEYISASATDTPDGDYDEDEPGTRNSVFVASVARKPSF